jgi:hypothetical protein
MTITRGWLLGVISLLVAPSFSCGRTSLWDAFSGGAGGRSADWVSSGGSSGAGGMAAARDGGAPFVTVDAGNTGAGAVGGRLEQHAELYAEDVRVWALGAAPDGRVAMGGSFKGRLDWGGQVLTSDDESAAFVAVVDAAARLQWLRLVDRGPAPEPCGLAFTPDGAVVAHVVQPEGGAFAARFDERGTEVWRRHLGRYDGGPATVSVARNGDAWLTGTPFRRMNAAGEVVQTMDVRGDQCSTNTILDFDMDDDGALIISGRCSGPSVAYGFLQKRDANGTIAFEKRLMGSVSSKGGGAYATVDHSGRITIATALTYSLTNGEGETVVQTPGSTRDIWVAQYSPEGDRLWQRLFADTGLGGSITGLASNTFDDVVMVGQCSHLQFGQIDLLSRPDRAGSPSYCVLKLASDGTPVWGHLLEGALSPNALTTDATAHVWLGGQFDGKAWIGEDSIVGNQTTAGLVLRLNP